MRNLLSIVCNTAVIYVALLLGCQSKKVSYYHFPDTYERLKKIEKEVFPVGFANAIEADGLYNGTLSLPDYFDFGRAVDAYEEGRRKALNISMPSKTAALSVYCETNLVDQATRDGFEEQLVRNSDMVLKRNVIRKQRQYEFWGIYLNDGNKPDDLAIEEANMTTNYYAHLLSSYIKGYRNGCRVVAKIRKSPIATRHGLAHADLGANVLRRAYVYGWYSACHDYFSANYKSPYIRNTPQEGVQRGYYAFWLSFYMELEGKFLKENAARKESIKE